MGVNKVPSTHNMNSNMRVPSSSSATLSTCGGRAVSTFATTQPRNRSIITNTTTTDDSNISSSANNINVNSSSINSSNITTTISRIHPPRPHHCGVMHIVLLCLILLLPHSQALHMIRDAYRRPHGAGADGSTAAAVAAVAASNGGGGGDQRSSRDQMLYDAAAAAAAAEEDEDGGGHTFGTVRYPSTVERSAYRERQQQHQQFHQPSGRMSLESLFNSIDNSMRPAADAPMMTMGNQLQLPTDADFSRDFEPMMLQQQQQQQQQLRAKKMDQRQRQQLRQKLEQQHRRQQLLSAATAGATAPDLHIAADPAAAVVDMPNTSSSAIGGGGKSSNMASKRASSSSWRNGNSNAESASIGGGGSSKGATSSAVAAGLLPPQISPGIASQLMLRSSRGQRNYDVPQIECPPAMDGMERFACPSPDRQGRYRCIDDHVLCDGFIDCPKGEDEERQACMFYKTTKAHLDVLADALLRWARGR